MLGARTDVLLAEISARQSAGRISKTEGRHLLPVLLLSVIYFQDSGNWSRVSNIGLFIFVVRNPQYLVLAKIAAGVSV